MLTGMLEIFRDFNQFHSLQTLNSMMKWDDSVLKKIKIYLGRKLREKDGEGLREQRTS